MATARIKVIQSWPGDGGHRQISFFDSYSGVTGVDGGLVFPLAGTACLRGQRSETPDTSDGKTFLRR